MKLERNSKMSELEENQEETQLILRGQKPRLKGGFRCSKCHGVLVDINNVSFKPIELGNRLKTSGYTHVCLSCKIAFSREVTQEEKELQSLREDVENSDYVCPQCNGDIYKTNFGRHILYNCPNCQLLFEKKELKKEAKR